MTFGALGAVFVVLVGAGAFIMKLPTPEYVRPLLEKARQNATVAAVDMTGSQMVRTPTFWVFMVYLMLVTCGDSGDNDSIAKLYMLLKAVG